MCILYTYIIKTFYESFLSKAINSNIINYKHFNNSHYKHIKQNSNNFQM